MKDTGHFSKCLEVKFGEVHYSWVKLKNNLTFMGAFLFVNK